MNTPTIQAKDLLKTTDIYKASEEDTLASALSQVTRTHDAVFVFGEKNKFLGIINPYYTIFQKNNPPETKLKHCLFHPPVITPETYIWDIAKLMNESKVYYLPVFDRNAFLGIVSLNRVLGALLSLSGKSIQFPFKKQLITIDRDATLQEAYNRLRDERISRLPVVDPQQHLVGLITRFDIQRVISEPKEKPRFLSMVVEKENFLDRPIDGHFRKVVVTATKDTSPREIIEKLYTQNVGSVIVIDQNRKPIGIVSTHDVLKAVGNMRPSTNIPLELRITDGFIHEVQLTELVNQHVSKINKSHPVEAAHAVLKTDKNAAGKPKLFEFSLQISFKSREQNVTAHSEGHDWKIVVRDTLNKIKAQLFD